MTANFDTPTSLFLENLDHLASYLFAAIVAVRPPFIATRYSYPQLIDEAIEEKVSTWKLRERILDIDDFEEALRILEVLDQFYHGLVNSGIMNSLYVIFFLSTPHLSSLFFPLTFYFFVC